MSESFLIGRPEPYISASSLADLMVSSERKRRTIAAKQKWRSPPALIPYQEPGIIIANFLGGKTDFASLNERIELTEKAAPDSEWKQQVNDLNIGMMKAFVSNFNTFALPNAELKVVGTRSSPLNYGGTTVGVSPHLLVLRTNKLGKKKVGVARFEYAKEKVYSDKEAAWLTSILFDFARQHRKSDGEAERDLCICIDVNSGKVQHAPGNAVSRTHEMKAVCQSIAERWASIPAPAGPDDC